MSRKILKISLENRKRKVLKFLNIYHNSEFEDDLVWKVSLKILNSELLLWKVSVKILNSGIILKSLEGPDMVNVLKIWNTFLFLFSSKFLDIRAGIHRMGNTLIRQLLKKQSDLGLHCLSRPFSQATTVKRVLSGHSKRRPKLVFKTNYRLMKVKSIADCNTFDLH